MVLWLLSTFFLFLFVNSLQDGFGPVGGELGFRGKPPVPVHLTLAQNLKNNCGGR